MAINQFYLHISVGCAATSAGLEFDTGEETGEREREKERERMYTAIV